MLGDDANEFGRRIDYLSTGCFFSANYQWLWTFFVSGEEAGGDEQKRDHHLLEPFQLIPGSRGCK
jgi:hypothetical protein